jgi:hypothetical protein
MDDAQTQNLGLLMHTFSVYNKTQNLYPGSNLCDILVGQLHSQGKQEAGFCSVCNRDPLLI